MKLLSIVIPTYNRCETLKKTLSAYLGQTALQNIAEIIVVDDGSTDSTQNIIARLAERSIVPIRYFRQENKGPAAARNVGIRETTSELILFTDDDIIPSPTLVAEHLEWHSRFPELPASVLGQVTWAPEVKPTPFMNWYGAEELFAFARFTGQTELDYMYFYSCNVSLKLKFLRNSGTFDEDFKVAAWEDIELSFRLNKAGMRLLYNPNALAHHYQYVSFDDAIHRTKKAGLAEKVFRRKEAGLHHWSSRSKPVMSLVKQRFRKAIAVALLPLTSFMDSKLPLPWSVYRVMLRVYRQNGGSS
jgi:glycosyltransferase involved in cell wall biosynthesis